MMRLPDFNDTKANNQEWVGVYYPTEGIDEPRTKALLCLIFDKVICHFTSTGMACGGSSGAIDFFSDDPLVDAEVIELREELLLSEIEPKSTPDSYWGKGEDFEKFVELQVTAMALQACSDSNVVPVTDKVNAPIPVQLVNKIDPHRFAKLQAASLAIQSLDIVIPLNTEITGEDILEVRYKLRDQLIPFRRAMLSLAPTVRQGISSDSSIEVVSNEAKYVVETRIIPALYDLQDRLSKETGQFWRRMVLKSGMLVPKMILNWMTKDTLSGAISSIESAKEVIFDVFDRKTLLNSLKIHGGLGYLLKVEDIMSSDKLNR